VALAAVSPGLSPNDTINFTRQGRTKYGFYVNFDQALTDNVGAFGRFSWNDGRTEIMSFTDITSSVSGGLSIKGTPWGRPNDTIGIAGAVNWISADFATYLANGGLGIMIGDGALTYGSEAVAETYYSLQVAKGLFVTADYQFLANPAYNAVRGPVHVFSGRLMAKF
jgi:high affinity Mn2+ porin